MSARAPHPHQTRPNRRYRRLLPTALAVAALAATGSSLRAPAAHAAGARPLSPPPRAKVHGGPARAALVPRADVRAGSAAARVTGT